jgi:hypothetical protein
MNIADDERKAIEDLLPWRAAGTLSRGEAQRVDAALAADPELARRYALVRGEVTQTIQLNEALGTPSPRSLDVLFAKIDAEPGRKPAAAPTNILDRVIEFFASLSPHTLAFGAAAAALVLTLQAGVIGNYVLKDKASGGYETASEASKPLGAGSYVLIRFAPQTNADAITRFLQSNKLTIANGPSAGGLYLVRATPTKISPADLQSLADRLQHDKAVGFIVPLE